MDEALAFDLIDAIERKARRGRHWRAVAPSYNVLHFAETAKRGLDYLVKKYSVKAERVRW